MENQLGLGALHSPIDSRTYKHPTMGIVPIVVAGEKYLAEQHEHQHYVGICTAISLVQNAEKVFGKKYSPDFQYLLQKKFIDGNWEEGSAIFSALKVGKNYGFLPIEQFTYVTEEDRKLPYPQYIAKLQAIPDSEITRLLTLCKDKVTAYAQVDISSRDTIAKAIFDSEAGILCRYEVGKEWFTPSWNPKDINPLKAPEVSISGHAITGAYIENTTINLANTWGKDWNEQGNGDADFANYKPTEAWIPYYNYVPSPIIKNLTLQKTILQRVLELLKELTKK